MSRLLPLCLLLLGSVAFAAPALHHFATSLAEVDHNSETEKLEVALSMNSADLEWVLSRREGTRVNLEKTEGVDDLIAGYLEEVFRAKRADGSAAGFTWVGKEFEAELIWLYFELDLPGGIDGAELSNQVLMRWERDQVNRVTFRDSGTSRALTFDRKHKTLPLALKVEAENE